MKRNKMIALGLSAVMALSLAACGNANDSKLQPPNPFAEYETLADMEKEVGFDFSVPSRIDGFDECEYRADKDDSMAEVIFKNGDEEIRFRKAAGDEDVSGNYTKFSEQERVDVDGATVTMKGENGAVNLATWSADGYAYSIDCTTAVDKVTMTDYIRVVNAEEPNLIGGDPSTWGPAGDGGPLAPPSPFLDCGTMNDAAALAGFDMSLPGTPDRIQAWKGTMIQAFYGENGNDMLIRKAVGSEDCSGDYNSYAQEVAVDGVTLKGENDAFSLAVWEKMDILTPFMLARPWTGPICWPWLPWSGRFSPGRVDQARPLAHRGEGILPGNLSYMGISTAVFCGSAARPAPLLCSLALLPLCGGR